MLVFLFASFFHSYWLYDSASINQCQNFISLSCIVKTEKKNSYRFNSQSEKCWIHFWGIHESHIIYYKHTIHKYNQKKWTILFYFQFFSMIILLEKKLEHTSYHLTYDSYRFNSISEYKEYWLISIQNTQKTESEKKEKKWI